MAAAKKAKTHKLPPPRAKSSVLQKHTPEFVHGALGRETSLTGCCSYINRFFEAHIMHGLFGCTNLKIFVCKKCLLSAFCKILCFDLLECLFL